LAFTEYVENMSFRIGLTMKGKNKIYRNKSKWQKICSWNTIYKMPYWPL